MAREHQALCQIAHHAEEAKKQLTDAVYQMAGEGLITTVAWDSTQCQLTLINDEVQGLKPASPVLRHHRQERRRRNGRKGRNSLMRTFGSVGIDLKELEKESRQAAQQLSSQVNHCRKEEKSSSASNSPLV